MSINIGPPHVDGLKPKIAVIGVGGAGGNAIANMIAAHVDGVEFLVANTDAHYNFHGSGWIRNFVRSARD